MTTKMNDMTESLALPFPIKVARLDFWGGYLPSLSIKLRRHE